MSASRVRAAGGRVYSTAGAQHGVEDVPGVWDARGDDSPGTRPCEARSKVSTQTSSPPQQHNNNRLPSYLLTVLVGRYTAST